MTIIKLLTRNRETMMLNLSISWNGWKISWINLIIHQQTRWKDKPQDFGTVVHTNRKVPLLQGRHYQKIRGMWNLKHEISSPKFYELFIKTKIKGDTDLYLNNFYNYTMMFLNEVKILWEDILPTYHKIKWNSEFSKHFVPDNYHPSNYYN